MSMKRKKKKAYFRHISEIDEEEKLRVLSSIEPKK